MGDLREPNGGGGGGGGGGSRTGGVEERLVAWPSTSISSNPSPSSIGVERWARAERATHKIICKVQPTAVSEERRRAVIDYVQRLVRGCLGCEVFPYGSVPLKTYLPDGDIDLTAFGGTPYEDALADDMVSVLEGEEQNKAAEFVVKDVQLIRAEVKLVKCIVQNIIVDISFNQIGGLCTLCFLEQVDRLIGKDHLFKRSIILIKAWCYYESRILGAHHGLISTYALETLVLYIFHLFHSTLNGPLAVLYKFLDYFSKFDWENYCISLTGPVRISSLPEIVAEAPENDGGELLLSGDFLRHCTDMFSVPSRGADANSRIFVQKHLNIIDPLKENNNLGRSVSKGNFYRIRSAFTYGARKLGRILQQPEGDIADELWKFFSNTLDRHGSGQRPDVQDPGPASSFNVFPSTFPMLETESSQPQKLISEMKSASSMGIADRCPAETSHDIVDVELLEIYRKSNKETAESGVSAELCHTKMSMEADRHRKGSPLTNNISGDVRAPAELGFERLRVSTSCGNESVSALEPPCHAPHLYFSRNNSRAANETSDSKQLDNCVKKGPLGLSQGCDKGKGNTVIDLEKIQWVGDDRVPVLSGLREVLLSPKALAHSHDLHHSDGNQVSACSSESLESLNILSDLSGDFENHYHCLQYGRWCYEYVPGAPALPLHSLSSSQFLVNNSWDAIKRSPQFKRNGFSHVSGNGVIPSPAFYTINPLLIPGVVFGLEELPKPRGTGTYFPNTSRPPQGYRPSMVKARNQAPSKSPRTNGRNIAFVEANLLDKSNHELNHSHVQVDQNGMKHGSSDIHLSFSPRGKGHLNMNGYALQSEGLLEFGSVGHVPAVSPVLERSRPQRPVSSSPQNSNPASPTPGLQRSRPFSRDHDRVPVKSSYHLKDEDDFPPLSV